jgi:ubiquinone/menaquinone biosynthesis C-methylase UbiE
MIPWEIAPSRTPSYFSFGYMPTGSFRRDLVSRFIGARNLIKRLQGPDIVRALQLRATDTVLDFGCGSGYIAVELSKLAGRTVGVDTIDYLQHARVPARLRGRLEFVQASGMRLPFPAKSFDRVLASEVLPMIPDPAPFLSEIKRVLKPDGRLVVVNGVGRPEIEAAYETGHARLRKLADRYPERFPASYAQFCREFQAFFGTGRQDFMSEAQICDALRAQGFALLEVSYSPGERAGRWLSWKQFENYVRTGDMSLNLAFLPRFLMLGALSRFSEHRHKGGVIVAASPS